MENNINETLVLKDEEGKEVTFEVIMKLDIEGKKYIIVTLADEEVDAIAFRIDTDENGEETYVTIDDDKEFEIVCEAYETLSLENEI
ncbi:MULTISPECIES: DUF1292 domain-containing protein [Clostridium]|uniref:UPF0473 protein NT01CX_2277 n=1 Tax=Clostridium novyi (strain NT) TaxID=386415 RepID=A0Q148_CLONN|nr:MULTISPECIES: DUF1292 domain-containing protein [Clostridium]ABK62146.1 conserved hypothetical protein [Clostridium novyi NT]KEH87410.1 hypothetical protein Z966_11305 [Clostridium novyi A str. NCTC 538]KEH87770.1 hypothetical protein Z967_02880 [Clostridium novyi A str. 4540]KEH89233.1 hypothetical protein Z965_03135 [Clostridium novyi A str. BKT29909]KEH93158.1 hypothetical protein Z963_02870 [Clostridium botulinum C/D str. It1]